jgi:hypothetical protein
MSIKIVKEPDIHVTAGDLARYRQEWMNFMSMYAGPPITLEEYIRGRRCARTVLSFPGDPDLELH